MEADVINRRATLFVSVPIVINGETLPKFVEAFNGLNLLPSVNKGLGLKFTPQGVVQENVISLDMKYLDETLKVSIGPDRFDIVGTKRNESMDEFLKKVRDIIAAISKTYPEFTRLALCSTLFFDMNISLLNKVYQKIASVQDEYPIEWQIRKILRDKIEKTGEVLTINKAYTLSRNITQIGPEDPTDRILLDIDINTVVGNDLKILNHQQSEFWDTATSAIEDAVKYYKDLILHD
ncbi:hypothetical protein [Bacteroides ihuae]|uniref:hypothetical protein n=1 Tax=Bacteroides ihuae TaxID=1852362 RepID=UPI0008D99A0C|nr:hypothetical protein [Bacteroides ihuae]